MTSRPTGALTFLSAIAAIAMLTACPSPAPVDAGSGTDAGAERDAGTTFNDAGSLQSDAGTTPHDAGAVGDAGTAGTIWPENVDCSPCTADEICWYQYDIDADTHTATCTAVPASCANDVTCDCIDTSEAEGDSDAVCAGFEYNSNSCSTVEARPVVYCEVNLG